MVVDAARGWWLREGERMMGVKAKEEGAVVDRNGSKLLML